MSFPLEPSELDEAWERVRDNHGCAGADGVTVERFAERVQANLASLYRLAASGAYRPFPLLEIRVEKKPGSTEARELLIPAIRDRILQTAAARKLSRSFEEEFLECSFAYRPGRSVDRAVARIRQCHERGYVYVVEADIHSFFDSVDQDLLLEKLAQHNAQPELNALVGEWVRASYWDGQRLRPVTRGIPQGSPISPLLANLFLQEFDLELEKSGRKLVRYSDDFIVLAKTPEDAAGALRLTGEMLEKLHLELKLEKTRVTDFDSGFQFLGALFLKEAIWIPWKREHRMGRVLFMARPLPLVVRRRFEEGRPEPAPRRVVKPGKEPSGTKTDVARSVPVAFLYVTEQGAVLRKSGDRFLVEKDDEVLLDLPYHKLQHVVLFGNVQVTAQAVAELLEKGVHLSFFSREGHYRGALTAPRGGNIELRLAQFAQHAAAERALELARSFVAGKIGNSHAVLAAYRKSNGAPGEEFDQELAALESSSAAAEAAGDLEVLNGVEGSAARRYFELLMRFNRSELPWNGRQMHPPPDPLNALLSLTYTLLTHELESLAEGVGLDPYLGFLHQPDYGRPSLALDLVEAFRGPVADRFVLGLVNRKQMQAEDFHWSSGEPCVMGREGLKRFFGAFEKWMLAPRGGGVGFRESLRREVERFSAALKSNTAFRPFAISGLETEGECDTSSVTT